MDDVKCPLCGGQVSDTDSKNLAEEISDELQFMRVQIVVYQEIAQMAKAAEKAAQNKAALLRAANDAHISDMRAAPYSALRRAEMLCDAHGLKEIAQQLNSFTAKCQKTALKGFFS
jgi:DNA repair exonuclease SbcCD ATPase subunit